MYIFNNYKVCTIYMVENDFSAGKQDIDLID